MRSYIFRVVLEQDGDRWHAAVPELEDKGASTWGYTRDEALRNIQEVVAMVVEALLEDGEELPPGVEVLDEPAVAINLA